jgi:ABC-type maltose transport system permease subunit
MSVANGVIAAAITAAIIIAIITMVDVLLIYVDAMDYDEAREEFRKRKRFFMTMIIIDVFLIIVAVFVPSKNTIIEMIVAKSVTPDAITNGVQSVKEIVDYIIHKIADLK